MKILGTAKNTMMNRLEFTADVVFTGLKPEQEIEMLDHAREVVLDTKPQEKSSKPADDEFEISEDFLE